ncbi:MAG TPA: hypothetical protein PLK38_04595, partial [Methanoregulaceae archaeon]|nr:hypothetical protein [Methanoregulaceae archaeon]
ALRRESNIGLPLVYSFCTFCAMISALRASPTTRFARIEGSPCGRLTGACDRFAMATPSLRSVAASASLVLVVWSCKRPTGLTLPAERSAIASLFRPAGQPVGL